MGWSRPPGPPQVWRDVELMNSSGKEFEFSIQEIPEDRYTEAVEHMCTIFIRDEATLSSLKTLEDPDAVEVLKEFWNIILKQNISIAAYDKSTENDKPKLAGLNILAVCDGEFEDGLKSRVILNEKMRKFFNFFLGFSAEEDPRQMFNVDIYLTAFGLSVHPEYRRLGLGKCLLETRNNIGRAYKITITETIFTSPISQKVAAAVGFEDHLTRNYKDIVDEDGKQLFPSLTGKQIKLMIKNLNN